MTAPAPPTLATPAFAIPLEGGFVFYFPLRRAAFLGNSAVAAFLRRLAEGSRGEFGEDEQGIFNLLSRLGVLGKDGDADFSPSKTDPARPALATLLCARSCNLACTYCYADAGRGTGTSMTAATAMKAVDFVSKNAVETGLEFFGVDFHGGGEPTLNMPLLRATVDYAGMLAKSRGLGVKFRAATNGAFSDETAAWLAENFSGVSASCDGLPEIHDRQRPFADGRPSSGRVLSNIARFIRAGFNFMVRMTVTADSVQRLPEGVLFLLDAGVPGPILVEGAYDMGRALGRSLAPAAPDFVSAFMEAKSLADGAGVKLFTSTGRLDVLAERFCGVASGNFCVLPGGTISACHEVFDEALPCSGDFLTGRMNDDGSVILDPSSFTRLQNLRDHYGKWCADCFARFHCAGDCLHLARRAAGDGPFSGHPRCETTRALVLAQLIEKIRENGGTSWSG